jgi:hypothetical protein
MLGRPHVVQPRCNGFPECVRLGLEVAVERAVRHAGRPGQPVDARAAEATLAEHPRRGIHDPLTRLLLVFS